MSFAYDASVRAAEDNARRLDTAEEELASALADVVRLTAERDAAYAIIAGRDTPPTAAEIRAHHAVGGAWLILWGDGELTVSATLRAIRFARELSLTTVRWTPLDNERRPCAWPTVTP